MFDRKHGRYMTRAIDETMHAEIQMILWNLIDEQWEAEKELDYLQIFELAEKHGEQHIVRKQEVPERRLKWIFTLKHATPIDKTIWCMDSEDYQMMLLPRDY